MILGVGCDIVQLARIEKAMINPAFLKILTPDEIPLYEALPQPRKIEWLAGRFAAKEAVIKAISPMDDLLLSQISILYDGKRPICILPNYRIHLSIAHEKDYAVAYAMVEKGDAL